jgi:hypothetical protein
MFSTTAITVAITSALVAATSIRPPLRTTTPAVSLLLP